MNATLTEDLVRNVVQEVLASMGRTRGGTRSTNGGARSWGVFTNVDDAVSAASGAQKEFACRGLDDRRKAVNCIRRICLEQAKELGREELEETKIGRLEHKIDKLRACAERVPGVE